MATVTERRHESGRVTWRVCLRKKGIKCFCITFDNLDVACNWIESNEIDFYRDPEKYFKLRTLLVYKMQRKQQRVLDNIIRSKKIMEDDNG